MPFCRRLGCTLAAALLVSGCSTVSYYAQSIGGHAALMQAARPIPDVMADPATSADLRARLQSASQARRFASDVLGLPDNGSYTRYADLKRPYVVWNVVAAPELSLRVRQSCFPVVGCLDYRGYYREADARAFAEQLRLEGWEVQVGGVPAYSTLGWYEDPLVNTVIRYPQGEVARLIFHELAHQAVYAKNDTMFNESFATTIEAIGMERWLREPGNHGLLGPYEQFAQRRRDFIALLLDTRQQLAAVYGEDADGGRHADAPKTPLPQGLSDEQISRRRAGKAQAIAQLRERYEVLKREKWGGFDGYDGWFRANIDNARFASVGTYHQWVPALRALYDRCESCQHGRLDPFIAEVRALARLPRAERRKQLAAAMPAAPAASLASSPR